MNMLLSAVAGPVLASVKADLQARTQQDVDESASISAWLSLLPSQIAQLVSEVQVAKGLLIDAEFDPMHRSTEGVEVVSISPTPQCKPTPQCECAGFCEELSD